MAERAPVLVCGAGAAGMAAALAAARCGAEVWLVESASQTGGTVANVLIHTLGGLFDSTGQIINDGLPRQLADRLAAADPAVRPRRMGSAWVLSVCPDVYRVVTRQWLREQPNITVVTQARVAKLSTADGRVNFAEITSQREMLDLPVRALIDATGSAAVVRLANPDLVFDETGRAAGGLMARLRGLAAGALEFPRGLGLVRAMRAAAANGKLPKELCHAWTDRGVRPNEAYLKLMVPLPDHECDPEAMTAINHRARENLSAAMAFLRGWPGFEAAEIDAIGEVGVRDGGRVRGEYCLTAVDVRRCQKFPDAACRCAWPIEFWDREHGVKMDYLPAGDYYEIPLRALKARGFTNLWVAGKCLSADREAHASARIAGTCWAMGEAVGRAAAS